MLFILDENADPLQATYRLCTGPLGTGRKSCSADPCDEVAPPHMPVRTSSSLHGRKGQKVRRRIVDLVKAVASGDE